MAPILAILVAFCICFPPIPSWPCRVDWKRQGTEPGQPNPQTDIASASGAHCPGQHCIPEVYVYHSCCAASALVHPRWPQQWRVFLTRCSHETTSGPHCTFVLTRSSLDICRALHNASHYSIQRPHDPLVVGISDGVMNDGRSPRMSGISRWNAHSPSIIPLPYIPVPFSRPLRVYDRTFRGCAKWLAAAGDRPKNHSPAAKPVDVNHGSRGWARIGLGI